MSKRKPENRAAGETAPKKSKTASENKTAGKAVPGKSKTASENKTAGKRKIWLGIAHPQQEGSTLTSVELFNTLKEAEAKRDEWIEVNAMVVWNNVKTAEYTDSLADDEEEDEREAEEYEDVEMNDGTEEGEGEGDDEDGKSHAAWIDKENSNKFRVEVKFSEVLQVDWKKFSNMGTLYVTAGHKGSRVRFQCSPSEIGELVSAIRDNRKQTNGFDTSLSFYFQLLRTIATVNPDKIRITMNEKVAAQEAFLNSNFTTVCCLAAQWKHEAPPAFAYHCARIWILDEHKELEPVAAAEWLKEMLKFGTWATDECYYEIVERTI